VLRWYLIHTKPLSEAVAQTNLERQGYQVYCPRALQTVRQSGRWLQRVVALFPRYVFLQLNEGCQPLGPVRSTPGVAGVVRFGPTYSVVPERVIRELQARADPKSGLHTLSCGRRLIAGAAVCVRAGPLGGLHGIFERQAGGDRVVVLLRLLGQDTSVCVPFDAIAAY
jgi:transcriptional antiterminator RfaH